MGNDERVSVIIPCFNAAGYLATSLASALGQTHTNLECIVVDDGSIDCTRAIVDRFREQDDRVRYAYKTNGGVASARNHGLRLAQGKWIQYLDADDWLVPDKLERQLQRAFAASRWNGPTLVYSDYEIVVERSHGGFSAPREVKVGQHDKETLLAKIVGKRFATPTPLHVNNTLMSADLVRHHRFDEAFVTHGDRDFFYRLLRTEPDLICEYVPFVSMRYRSVATGISKTKRKNRVGYLQFAESVCRRSRSDATHVRALGTVLADAARMGDRELFARAMHVVRHYDAPVHLSVFGREGNVNFLARRLDEARLLYPLLRARGLPSAAARGLIRGPALFSSRLVRRSRHQA